MENGQKPGFEDFFEKNQNTIYRIIRGYTRNSEAAKDILMDVMLKLFERWERVSLFDNVTGYAVRIGINMAKRLKMMAAIKKIIPIEPYDAENGIRDGKMNPEERTVMLTEYERLEDEMTRLKDIERNIILLKEMDELKFEEIARLLNLKLPTVKSHYRRGKIKLVEKLEDPYEEKHKMRHDLGFPGRKALDFE